jgi:DNA polymerase-1
MKNGPVILCDGTNLFIRNFTASPQMAEGQHVGGVLGFLTSLGYLIDMLKPVACVIAWEGGGSSRRRAIYPGYKGGRRPQKLNRFHEGDIPDTVENRDWQLGFLIALLRFLPVRQVYVPDCEADDVIGYMSRYCFKENQITIVSSDHDYYQLINDRVRVWSPNQKKIIDENAIIEKYSIHPRNFCVARCFDGDSSDCIPGVAGVGMKTLAKKFPQFLEEEVTIDRILGLSREASLTSKMKMYKSINESEEMLHMNWRLMNLDMTCLSATHVKKIEDSLVTPLPNMNKIELMRTLMKNGIKTFDVNRLFLQVGANLQ